MGFYVFVGIFVLIILFAIFKATKLGIEASKREKETKEARRCPICASTSFEDKPLEGVETSEEYSPSNGLHRSEENCGASLVETPREYSPSNGTKHLVRRICNKCGHVWLVEVTTIFKLETYYLPDGFHGKPYK
jgi:hypothetical protein